MELRHLRYFVAVAEELNVTRAAARLHVSQPPLSRQIRDLEHELDAVLLERSPQRVSLTPVGVVFLKEARKVLAAADEAVRKVRAATGADAGELRVGYAPTPSVKLLPRALQIFQKAAPYAHAILLDLSRDEMLAGVAARTLDAALIVRPPANAGAGIDFEKLFELPVGIVVSPAHRFASRRSVTLEEALAEPLVAFIRKGYSDYHLWLAEVVKLTGRKPRIVAQGDGATSVLVAVASGQGIAFGPREFVVVSGQRVKFVKLDPPPPALVVGVATRKGSRTATLDTFLKALRTAAKSVAACK